MKPTDETDTVVPAPASPGPPAQFPHPLTFFLTVDERRAVLRALRRVDRDRAVALKRLMRIGQERECDLTKRPGV